MAAFASLIGLTPKSLDILVKRGSTYKVSYAFAIGGEAVDLTGINARMQIRASYTAVSPAISLTSNPAAGIVISPSTGTVTITALATDTAAIAFNQGVWDLELYDGSGNVVSPLYGNAVIINEATK